MHTAIYSKKNSDHHDPPTDLPRRVGSLLVDGEHNPSITVVSNSPAFDHGPLNGLRECYSGQLDKHVHGAPSPSDEEHSTSEC